MGLSFLARMLYARFKTLLNISTESYQRPTFVRNDSVGSTATFLFYISIIIVKS